MKARLPQGMGGGPGNMQAMLRQAQKMQEDAAALQQELEEKQYSATAGGGAVKATVNGKYEIVDLVIQPEVIDPEDAEMLTDLVIAAVNEANRQAAEDAQQQMARVTGGLQMPGMF
ncbi:MAG: YbaB/EbfC family nucleoid-associated protein [Clostridia bacterium]|nr:YbaB/EbfC family nucleoid-associated protein [Clostridia bacterium]